MLSTHRALPLAAPLLLGGHLAHAAYDLDLGSTDSIKDVSSKLAQDLRTFYTGDQPGQVPGLLPEPYYWWECGAMFGAFIDYWYYTGDDAYNDIVTQGLIHQIGPTNDYMPDNQTLAEGNDDQGFWGMTVMTAAELGYPDADEEDSPGWLALAQGVFNTQAARWDTENCNGGLRWQIFDWNNGFNYKNSISQACFFNIAARLALYTGNTTYADWAVKTWDWMVDVKFMSDNYRIYDGAHVDDGCQEITPFEFSYNVGAFLLGAAAMYEYYDGASNGEEGARWHERVDGLLNTTENIFFYGDSTEDRIMVEIACEPVGLCDTDQLSFKAFLSRWMAATTKWAPWTYDRVKTLLRNSATAAIAQCTGGDNGRMCGFKWANTSGEWDGTTGVGQQMGVMEVVLGNMIEEAKAPVTNSTGGTSAGDPAGGGSPGGDASRAQPAWAHHAITSGDRAGASVLTFLVLCGLLTGMAFALADEQKTPRENWASFRSSASGVLTGAAFAEMVNAGPGRSSSEVFDEKGKGPAATMSEAMMVGGNGDGDYDYNNNSNGDGDVDSRHRVSPAMVAYPLPSQRSQAKAGGGGGRLRQFFRGATPSDSGGTNDGDGGGGGAGIPPPVASRRTRSRLHRRPF